MLASDVVEMVCAAHLSSYVEGQFQERGGLMVVGDPGVLKSTFIGLLDTQYHDALMLSDVNVQTLIKFRGALASGQIKTLVLPELAKVYERMDATAQNVEGTLRALVGEGFQAASFEDARIARTRARCTVIGAMTPRTQASRFDRWEESGFNRRFLWSLVYLDDPHVLDRAVVEWQRIDFGITHVPRPPVGGTIPNLTTREERRRLQMLVKYQPGGSHALQLQLLTRMLSVLRWWYEQTGDTRDPAETLYRWGRSLGKEGAGIEMPEPGKANSRQERERVSSSAGAVLARSRWGKKKPRKRKGPVKKGTRKQRSRKAPSKRKRKPSK